MTSAKILPAAAAGALSGLVAAWAMNQFQKGWNAVKQSATSDQGKKKGGQQKSEPSTAKVADRLARSATGEPVPDRYRNAASSVVHYGFGAFLGAVYGVVGASSPKIRSGFGTLYGAAAAVGADELLVPAAGLAPPPYKTPLLTHVYSLVSHLVFGASLEGTRRAIDAGVKQVQPSRRNS